MRWFFALQRGRSNQRQKPKRFLGLGITGSPVTVAGEKNLDGEGKELGYKDFLTLGQYSSSAITMSSYQYYLWRPCRGRHQLSHAPHWFGNRQHPSITIATTKKENIDHQVINEVNDHAWCVWRC
jgi:hypothetical protein